MVRRAALLLLLTALAGAAGAAAPGAGEPASHAAPDVRLAQANGPERPGGEVAAPATLVAFPLAGGDSTLGVVVSDAIAQAFAGELETYGPAVAPTLLPPTPVDGGFINPTEYLFGRGATDRSSARLLRGALGADFLVTGTLTGGDERVTAQLHLATGAGVESFQVSAPAARPDLLVRNAVQAVGRRAGVEPDLTILPEAAQLGPDGAAGQGLTLLALGLFDQASQFLEGSDDLVGRAAELRDQVRLVMDSTAQEIVGREALALFASRLLNSAQLEEAVARPVLDELSRRTSLPALDMWPALLSLSAGDTGEAQARLADLPDEYSYARSALLGLGGADGELVARLLEEGDLASLLALSAIGQQQGDVNLEREALERLTRVAPGLVYPFERLSFIALDEDDPLAAAQWLAVATRLEPESDLYWTNLGWSYYLLGLHERSEAASERAAQLNPTQYIGLYNLGLVRGVTGRLAEAVPVYRQALLVNPEVDEAAIEDLEVALEQNPDEPALNYLLGMVYQASGQREAAAAQFEAYLQRGSDPTYLSAAQENLDVVTAPLPPILLTNDEVTVSLGRDPELGDGPFRPGDPVYPSFEVYTPGEQLPSHLDVHYELFRGQESVLTYEQGVAIPPNAVAIVLDSVELTLPQDAPAGDYRLVVTVQGEEGQQVEGEVELRIEGEAQLLRQLLGRGIAMQRLGTGAPLYDSDDLRRPERLVDTLIEELQRSAPLADQVVPEISEGRFAGSSGGEAFRRSTSVDVQDFLHYLLESGAHDTTILFADAYAQWVNMAHNLRGTPAP